MTKRRIARKGGRHLRPHRITLSDKLAGLDVDDIMAMEGLDEHTKALLMFMKVNDGRITARPGEDMTTAVMRQMDEWASDKIGKAYANVKAHVAGRASDEAAWMWTVTLLNSPLMESFDEQQQAEFVAEKMGTTPEQVDAYITELMEAGCFDDLDDDSLGDLS